MSAKTTPKKNTRRTADKNGPSAPKKPLARPAVGQRYEGVKDHVPTHYLVAEVGKGPDPLVAVYVTNLNARAGGSRFTTTIIRWSLFCTTYKARLFPLAESVRTKLDVARDRRGAVVGSRTGR